MFVQPNLAIRLDAIFPNLTPKEVGNMLRIAYDLEDPSEFSLCLAEELEFCEQRIIRDALHGHGLNQKTASN